MVQSVHAAVSGHIQWVGDGGEPGEVRLERLPPGSHFRLQGFKLNRDGMVLRHGRGSSFVLVEAPAKHHEWVTADGKRVEFASGATRFEYWSLGSMVLPLDVPREDGQAVEEFLRSMEYHPTKEEVEQMGTSVALPGTKKVKAAKAPKPAKVKREKKVAVLHDCLCGCGQQCGGRFKMGHDGKFYAFLRKLVKGEIKFTEMPQTVQKEVKNTEGAKAYLKSHGH